MASIKQFEYPLHYELHVEELLDHQRQSLRLTGVVHGAVVVLLDEALDHQ